MIKTLKEILIVEKGESIIIPAGTYAEADDNYNFYFLGSEAEGYYVSQRTVENHKDMFIEVNVNEYEILCLLKSFLGITNRVSVLRFQQILHSIKESHPEIVKEFLDLLGQDDVSNLHLRIKELESQIFILKMKDNQPYTQPYTHPISMCKTCGIDLSKNTGYVCFNSACPNRVWVTNSTSTGTELKFESTNSTMLKPKEEEE